MRTVGSILKEAREDKFYSLEDVEKATKIRKELLQALEDDDYTKLPPITFVQGFIKNYARFLDLDPKTLLAIFRREFSDSRQKAYVMNAFSNPLDKTKLNITPTRVIGVVVSLIIISFFAYLWTQYHQFVGPPNLALTSPSDQATVDNQNVTIVGKTDPDTKVTINNQQVSVDSEGNFKQELNLSSQVNKIDIVAISKFNQKSTIERTVYLKK